MRFLINASNLKTGGGLQVADSVCCQLFRFKDYQFVVVLSPYMNCTKERLNGVKNVEVFTYEIPNDFRTIVLGKDDFLDKLVKEKRIDAVLTVFGPSRWRPQVKHLSGFALPQLVIPESPYFQRMGMFKRVKWWLWCVIRKWSLGRSADAFWTENPYISNRLETLFSGHVRVYTVSNYYNQVFDQPEMWKRSIKIPEYDGVTCLSISSNYLHKNFEIIPEIILAMRELYPSFNVRFVLTIDAGEISMPDNVRNNILFIGKVDVSECPNLYEQADIMFMPSLLECFTATYPEAMKMEVPIVTTDLEFARGLCGDAASYYSALDAKAAAKAIYKVATNTEYAQKLLVAGREQLLTYDNYEQRAEKLVRILEGMVKQP